jgi:hypothetical protein
MIRRWAGGFSVAMTLAPEAWGRLIEDERTQDLAVPFIGFFESDDPEFEPADDIAERLDLAAAAIPRAILVLRKLAKLRGADGFAANKGTVSGKIGAMSRALVARARSTSAVVVRRQAAFRCATGRQRW